MMTLIDHYKGGGVNTSYIPHLLGLFFEARSA